ncbi:GNAT family N-acetyltransferase/peptidase C39 family protein [Aurantimonas sp. VKM B-3413]|uniref:GNAT family N-acetyltransferase/peptidase C39 family protein n=1 Tax=Aurantimonas sp. VKM B-3413 TaxID=2779401 RepID=UPI001E5D2DEB|nr:GNAT family N-acetyltransferase/peptidase C39 family protein [Aurantimonas sp. VKM B-3413]MCB8837413.1 GNAT family N-acetyltransferase/peptidase C39 family protein [Aurantimonas sp. VKM B-3413]
MRHATAFLPASRPQASPPDPDLRIRPAAPADLDRLVALETAVFETDRISRRSFRNLIGSASAAVLVANGQDDGPGGPLLGYAALLVRRGTALARLYSLAVSGDAGGRGVGRALVKAAEAEAFARDRIAIRLEVREDNERAIRLYRSEGFRPIGRYLDYYADHMPALRFEKTLRGDTPIETGVPYYEQTTDFTCGACCLMMAMARDVPGFVLDPVMEIRLWREATTIFMMSGPGGCDPYGLAVTAHEFGLDAEIHVSESGDLFLEGVRSAEKQKVMALAQEDFRRRASQYEIPVVIRPFTIADVREAVAAGKTVVVLISGYHMFAKKVPHWVLAHGDDGRHIIIHDPWVADERGESIADAASLPVPYDTFDRIARFGKVGLRAAVFLSQRKN